MTGVGERPEGSRNVQVSRCERRDDYFALVNGPDFTVRWMLESHLAERAQHRAELAIPGFCACCSAAVDFAASFEGAWTSPAGLKVPNWREVLRCPRCHLNGRQRIVVQQIVDWVLGLDDRAGRRAYMMEQLSPVFRWASETFPWMSWTGSEYLGPGLAGGAVQEGIRHEDAENLSMPDASLDLFVSCDVFEHVDDPERAFREMTRVLRPGGRAILTFPMDPHLDENVRRAECREGRVRELLPPIYHGNPLSEAGSLVFTDFGWQVLTQLRSAGLRDCALNVYWSYELGYLGIQFYFAGHV